MELQAHHTVDRHFLHALLTWSHGKKLNSRFSGSVRAGRETQLPSPMASCRSGRASDPELLNCFLYAPEPKNTSKQDGGVGLGLLGSVSVALGCNGALPLEQARSDSGFPCTGHRVSRVRKEWPCPKQPAGQGPESAARQLGNLGIPAGRAGRELEEPPRQFCMATPACRQREAEKPQGPTTAQRVKPQPPCPARQLWGQDISWPPSSYPWAL